MLMESKKTNTEDELSVLEGIRDEIKGLKRKGAKQTAQLFFSVLLAVLVGLGGGIYCGQHWDDVMQKLFPNSYSASTTTILEEKLDKQSKLNTGIYKQVSSYDSGKIYNNSFSKKLKINSKSMTFKYTGYVEAGIKDLTSVTININSQTNVVTLDNIKIEITNVYIDPSSITDAKQSKNAFNQLTIEDFASAQKALENKVVSDAQKSGIISEAQKSAEATLLALFGDYINGYTVNFNWS